MFNWFEKHNKISFLIALIMGSIIFYASSISFSGTGGGISYKSYIYHFTAFSYFALFLLISLSKGKYNKPLMITAISIAILYGILDEIHQYFVPNRFPSLIDILTNSIGILSISIAYIKSKLIEARKPYLEKY
jgi:hypothetical protein